MLILGFLVEISDSNLLQNVNLKLSRAAIGDIRNFQNPYGRACGKLVGRVVFYVYTYVYIYTFRAISCDPWVRVRNHGIRYNFIRIMDIS